MRNIKFRAWDTKTQQYLQHVPEKEYMIEAEDWDHHDLDDAGGLYPHRMFDHFSFNGRIVFEQYTELKDKNGKEIYEGDRVSFCRYIENGVEKWEDGEVHFFRGSFWLGPEPVYTAEPDWNKPVFGKPQVGLYAPQYLEVKGNIHETKV